MIYLKGGRTATNVKELLEIGFGTYYKFKETYKDEQCTILQCKSARRSFTDLLELADTYFQGTDETELLKALKEFGVYIFFCEDIQKVVTESKHNSGITFSGNIDNNDIKGEDGVTVNEIKEMYDLL